MEGLIPKVYKSIKRSMTVKEPYQSYSIEDFYPDGYNYKYPQHSPLRITSIRSNLCDSGAIDSSLASWVVHENSRCIDSILID